MLLSAIGWLLIGLGVLLFISACVGFVAPSVFKKPDEAKPPSRLMFFLSAWLIPPWPIAIGAVMLAMVGGDKTTDMVVRPTDLKGTWPLTVQEVEIRCPNASAPFAYVDGKMYALNGVARTVAQRNGYEQTEAIWAYGPDGSTRVSLGELTQLGLAKCQQSAS